MSQKATFTVRDETIDDALSAVALLRKTDGIDHNSIFVLGHSLGGMMAPRIGKADPKIAGFIVMAGPTRLFEDIILDQLQYISSLSGQLTDEEMKSIESLKLQVARVKDPKLSSQTPDADLPLGISACYWLDLRGYNPAKTASEINQPMLILQGGRDYQVTMDDLEGWKQYLSSRKDVEIKVYPKLNHLFVEGIGKATPAEYEMSGHVSEEVIDDIACWLKVSR